MVKKVLVLLGWLAASVAAQAGLVAAAVALHQKWLLAPLAAGLWAMRLLPADPRTAGSFIVFPTLAQTVLAVAVNTVVFGGVWWIVRRVRGRGG